MPQSETTHPMAMLAFLPSHDGDGYGYGGGAVLTIGSVAINFGERDAHCEIAKKLAQLWNEHHAAPETTAWDRECVICAAKWSESTEGEKCPECESPAPKSTAGRWRDFTTADKAIADTKADPNRSYREDALIAVIERLRAENMNAAGASICAGLRAAREEEDAR